MLKKTGLLNNPAIDKIVFAFSVFVCAFWYLSQHINVYHIALVGAIFELASLPMLLLFILLPILSILILIKKKFTFKSLSLYSLLLLLTTFLLLNFQK